MNLPPVWRALPLPRGWPRHVRSAVLHAISLASAALTLARSRTASIRDSKRRLVADLERAENGSYILGNPSSSPAGVMVRMPGLGSFYKLDADGRRTGKLVPRLMVESGNLQLPAGGRVEFAAKGAVSVHEHRQAMLRKRQADQEAAMNAAANAAKARTLAREKASAANPLPKGTIVVVQAEDFTGQGGGKVGVSDNKKAIIGKAFSSWDAVGHWLEYTFDVPAAGYYNLTLCYCSELALCERRLTVNGTEQEPFAPVIFPGTGGWANGSDDWRLFTAGNPVAKHPLLIELNKGRNVLRLTNTNGRGVNLDYLSVHSSDVKPTRKMLSEKAKQTHP